MSDKTIKEIREQIIIIENKINSILYDFISQNEVNISVDVSVSKYIYQGSKEEKVLGIKTKINIKI